jgi:hypothetical protein
MRHLIPWILLLGVLAIEIVSAFAFVCSPLLRPPKQLVRRPAITTSTQPSNRRLLTTGTTPPPTTTTILGGSTNGESSSDDDSPVLATRAGQHFQQAGVALQEAATTMGPTSNAGPHLWHDVGDAMIDVGEAWTMANWEAVTYAAEEAAATLHALARYQVYTNTPVVLQSYCSGMGNEFRQISNIAGCSSIGPLTAVPNLLALSKYLKEIAMFVEDESNLSLYPDGPAVGQSIRKASASIEALVQCYA